MFEKFLKKSGWTDIIISLIFVLFGFMMIASPESIISVIAILLGIICIATGILKLIDYYSTNKQDNYLLSVSIVMIITGIIVMFCSDIITTLFRLIIAIWIIYSGLMNFQTCIVWKEYKSKLWLTTLLFSIIMIIGGIYILINTGALLQIIGTIIVIYGILDIIENVIFIKKIDNYLE